MKIFIILKTSLLLMLREPLVFLFNLLMPCFMFFYSIRNDMQDAYYIKETFMYFISYIFF